MKIIDAFWEKRNLGVDCKEIVINQSDSIADLHDIVELSKCTEYIVVKVPTSRFDVHEFLSQLGFIFVESSINVELQIKNAVLSPLQQRLNNSISYSEMNQNDLDELFFEIKNGLFATDRIIVDKFFTPQQAANRYINWIQDELTRTSQVYKITYKNDSIGFFTFKKIDEGVYYPFLAGMYKKYLISGLGFAITRKPIEEAILRNGNKISTYVSSNNEPALKAVLFQGFYINNINYIFINHSK